MYSDLLLALSGHPGSIFIKDSGGEFTVSEDTPCIAPHEASLLNRILRIATYYAAIENFKNQYKNIIAVRKTREPPNAGLYTAALCFGLDRGLKVYRDTLIQLDLMIRENPETPLSLLQFHLEKFQTLFPVLSNVIVQITANNVRGCGVLELLHQSSACGIPFVKDLLQELLQSCHSVFYQQLSAWILHGHVKDYFGEFFITEISEDDGEEGDSAGGLLSKYSINVAMVPSYIEPRVIHTIHFIGSSVHIFGSEKKRKIANPLQKQDEEEFVQLLKGLQNRNKFCPIEFERVICIMRERVAGHLYTLMMKEGNLLETLRLFKDFFLLGRGELFLAFIDSADKLMQSGGTRDKESDVNRLFLKAYTQLNFKDEDRIQQFHLKLDKTKVADSDMHGLWNNVGLTYDVQWPLHVLFTDDVIEEYDRLFRFLLKLRRCQLALQNTWTFTTKKECDISPKLLRLRSNLAFLIDNLQYYIHVDVLETNYTVLFDKINKTDDYEAIKKAHDEFLGALRAWTFQNMDTTAVSNFIVCLTQIAFIICNQFIEQKSNEMWISSVETKYEYLVSTMYTSLVTSASKQHNSLMNQLLLRIDYNNYFSNLKTAKKERLGSPMTGRRPVA